MQLDGFSIGGYRSFGLPPVRIASLGKVNVFIGPNNCGKSNILRACVRLSESRGRTNSIEPLDDLEKCQASDGAKLQFGYQLIPGSLRTKSALAPVVRKLPFFSEVFSESNGGFWLTYEMDKKPPAKPTCVEETASTLMKQAARFRWGSLASQLFKGQIFSEQEGVERVARWIAGQLKVEFDCHYIEAFRKIDTSAEEVTFSGGGLISRLRKLKSPERERFEDDRDKFRRISEFVRDLLNAPEAELHIPAEKQEVLVSMGGLLLPLESLGTGIHELVILAAAVTLHEGVVFCIEEPEIHLHPSLQKKFVSYLLDNTTNQYLISSHSNAFLDVPGVNIYRCWQEAGLTRCEQAATAEQKEALLDDLGCRPSDLLLANYVVWVEGPSDRIYVRAWLRSVAPELVEGVHYAVMFYGGRLLSHLSYEGEVEDFIKLSRLNRKACIIIDSDRTQPGRQINATKKRVVQDFEESGAMAWVTHGRTIENYVPKDRIAAAITAVHPKVKPPEVWDRLSPLPTGKKERPLNKVAIARAVVTNDMGLERYNLRKRARRLAERIRRANGLPEAPHAATD